MVVGLNSLMSSDSPRTILLLDKRVTGKNSDGQLVYSTDFSNTYYHPSLLHIKRKNPAFNGIVLIDNVLFNSLDVQQRQVMSTYDF